MAPKSKAQKMSLGDFLGDQALGSWADEMEDAPVPSDSRTGYGGGERRAFSSAGPSSSNFGGVQSFGTDRGFARQVLPLPSKPPYTAHLGNLSYDVTNGDVEDFFAGCEVTNIRIVEDKMENKPKGFGYCEFRSLEGLKKALDLDGHQFQGRNIRISVAEPSKERAESRVFDDWTRKGPLPDLPGQPQRRVSERGGFGMERGGSRRGGDFESAGGAGAAGGARDLGSWERKGPLSPVPGAEPQRGAGRGRGDGPPRERRPSPQWGEGARDGSRPPREFQERPPPVERQPTAAEMDNQWRARMKPDAPAKETVPTPETSTPTSPAQPSAPASRPRLNLQKRTVSEAVNTDSAASDPSKPNPFGAAKPIDTAAREREVVEKRQLALRQKKEADDKAREEKKAQDAAAKAAAADATATKEGASGEAGEGANGDETKENGAETKPNVKILSRIDDEEGSVASSAQAQDEPANGEIVEDKATKPREFTRPPPRGPKAQSGTWRRKSSTPGTPSSPAGGPTAGALEDDGWSTVPSKNGRGGKGRGGARAIAS